MKNITMQDIATMAGVSKATVSMVLSKKDKHIGDDTKRRIVKICNEVGYIPNSIARSLATKKSQTIGVLLPDIENPFFSELFRAIEDRANTLNYNVFLCNTDNDEKKENKYLELLIGRLVDGIIIVSEGHIEATLKFLKNNNIPYVVVDRQINDRRDYNGVYCCNKDGIYKAVEYLYSQGRRNIAFVTGPIELEVSRRRLEAYKDITERYGIYSSENVFKGNFKLSGGICATEDIINHMPSFDAIMYSNDFMAIGGMKVLKKRGYRIPEDVSVIGYDNISIGTMIDPELTTIAQPTYEIGKVSCDKLVNIIEKIETVSSVIEFMPELIIRKTT
ncbi:MAG: LacI family DNA-binding transcriptional regulator [Clostridium sp.]